MACACQSRKAPVTYLWRSADGTREKPVSTEVEARALVATKGGSYTQVTRG